MQTKQYSANARKQELICPACDERHRRVFQTRLEPEPLLAPEIGQLTQCDHCLTMLEYIRRHDSLSLRVAPQKRVDAFNELVKDSKREPTLTELVAYWVNYCGYEDYSDQTSMNCDRH